jgi:hypothetical protein
MRGWAEVTAAWRRRRRDEFPETRRGHHSNPSEEKIVINKKESRCGTRARFLDGAIKRVLEKRMILS